MRTGRSWWAARSPVRVKVVIEFSVEKRASLKHDQRLARNARPRPPTAAQGPPRLPSCVSLACTGTVPFPESHSDSREGEGAQRLRGVSCFPCGRAANGFVDFGDGPLDGGIVQVIHQAIEWPCLDSGRKHVVADAVGRDALGGFEGVW